MNLSHQHRLLLTSFASVLLALTGCSGVTEDSGDCESNEFYDGALEICRACPALELPECPDGCGISIETPSRGCAIAECNCEECDTNEFYNPETVACESCPSLQGSRCADGCVPVGTTAAPSGCQGLACACDGQCGACEPCPVPDCGDPVCGCATEATGTINGVCPEFACACPEEIPDTHEIMGGACHPKAE
jgi:hypothetical protein